ncbi:hypothetical protein Ga0074812_1681 [Parafrankia irregularis]|uniref:Uncharacterized protein n=1 Tax=Parafrankia irregularis TaxID=795642 RepID=A0A0S4R055_9ACTN|nr:MULTISPECIES: hypothetical protein [Parafrankia]MBE3206602.1 hypothetical protein [Parafrankia sp. CH37]MBE3206723.1 hypothetical protein [Parafrankia sp. CH37]CUU61248.1 hypothetical protein Ga0074812_1681 [Parafrankia irregularis]
MNVTAGGLLILAFSLLIGLGAAWIWQAAGARWVNVISAGAGAFAATAMLIFAGLDAWGSATAASRQGTDDACYPVVRTSSEYLRCPGSDPLPSHRGTGYP